MPGAEIKLEAVSIVLRGNFNPSIFQPRWFSAQGLVADEAADAAQVQIIHAQVTAFAVNRIDVQVTPDRFIAATGDATSYELVRDLVVGTFSVLRHTPLTMMGLNASAHLRSSSEETWHQLGHTLAPKQFWEGLIQNAGTRSLTIEGTRADKYQGYLRVKVEPSEQIRPGVFVDINDHFVSGSDEPGLGWSTLSEVLENEWQPSRTRAAALIEHIRSKV